jgi:hypothetical protein
MVSERRRPIDCINPIGPFSQRPKLVDFGNSKFRIVEKPSSGAISTDPYQGDADKCLIAATLGQMDISNHNNANISGFCAGCGRNVEASITKITQS